MTRRDVSVRLRADVNDYVRGMRKARDATSELMGSIDKTNDRTAWLAQGILALGPTLAPIGAAAAPILSGIATQMTVAAGAAGVLALAFNGVGDGLKALNAYQLEPTAANFEKLQLAMEKLGPDGAHFVTFLDEVGGKLAVLQMDARAGIFPGLEDGITSLMTKLPQFRSIVQEIASGLGDLFAGGGKALAGPRFAEFFDFLERNAKPLLVEMGQTIGNFVEGLAAMMVAFEPLTMRFSSGFQQMSRDFADWAQGLDESEGFSRFLTYIDQSIPMVIDLLGSMSDAFVQIVEAAAPVGDRMIPLLSKFLDIIGAIADTPLGPTFLGLAAAISVVGRASALAKITTGGFIGTLTKGPIDKSKAALLGMVSALTTVASAGDRASMSSAAFVAAEREKERAVRRGVTTMAAGAAGAAAMGLTMTGVAEDMGLSNTAMGAMIGMVGGPWGVAIGAAAGMMIDFSNANGDAEKTIKATTDAIKAQGGSIESQLAGVQALREEAARLREDRENHDNPLDWLQDVSMSDEELFGDEGSEADKIDAEADRIEKSLLNLHDVVTRVGMGTFGWAKGLVGGIEDIADGFTGATAAAMSFDDAMTALTGWADQNTALRNMGQAVRDLTKSMKDGFTLETQENIDNIATSFAQTLATIQSPSKKETFIDSMIAQMKALAEDAGPLVEQRLRGLIALMRDADKANIDPKIDIDDLKAKNKLQFINKRLREIEASGAEPVIDPKIDAAMRKLGMVIAKIGGIDQYIPVEVAVAVKHGASTIVSSVKGVMETITWDTGGFTGKGGHLEPAGVVHKNEVVLPEDIVKRDWPMLSSRYGHLPGFDQGGLVGSSRALYGSPDVALFGSALDKMTDGIGRASSAAIGMAVSVDLTVKQQVQAVKAEIAARKEAITALKAERDASEQAMKDRLRSDIFAGDQAEVTEKLGVTRNPDGSLTNASLNQQLLQEMHGNLPQSTPSGALGQNMQEIRAMTQMLQQLAAMGLNGAAFTELANNASMEEIQEMLAGGRSEVSKYERMFNQRERLLTRAGNVAGDGAVGEQIKEQLKEQRLSNRLLGHLEELLEDNPRQVGRAVVRGFQGQVSRASRGRR